MCRADLFLGALVLAGLSACSDDHDPAPPADLPGGWAEGIDGMWGLARTETEGSEIEGIGYAGGYEEAGGASGVTRHAPDQAGTGFNLYCSGHGPEAHLINMQGEVLHSWRKDWNDIEGAPPLDGPTQNTFRRVALLPEGGLLAIFGGRGLVRLDRDSNVQWVYPERAHHDLEVRPDGSTWTLIRSERLYPRVQAQAPIIDDYAVRLSAAGEELQRHSVIEALDNSPYAPVLHQARVKTGDLLHTNSIAVLDEHAASAIPSVSTGQLLLCIRELDLICVLDPRRGALSWAMRGNWIAPHDPSITAAGTLLLFDNLGRQGHSRVIELALPKGELQWSYAPEPAPSFSSLFCGTSQRLSNGNTLITESTKGRVFEVSPTGQTVWEFLNPERAGAGNALIAAIFDCVRVPAALDWLPQSGANR